MQKLIIVSIALIAILMPSAFATQENISLKSTYSVHLAHVGDKLVFVNDDTTNHTVTGKSSTGEIISSGIIGPNQNFTTTFLFPSQFSYYDQEHQGNVGIIYVYEAGTQFPGTIYNKTSTNDLFEKPTYQTTATPIFAFSNSTVVTFGISNQTTTITQPLLTIQTPTQQLAPVNQDNNATYWKQQATYWQNIANTEQTLIAKLKALLQ